jgi:hypothetical protein
MLRIAPECPGSKIFFIIFVDRIFTTLREQLFTKLSDAICAKCENACVYRGGHAD